MVSSMRYWLHAARLVQPLGRQRRMPNVVPPWLFAPPGGTMAPPVHTKLQELPFEKLVWPDFERLALRLVRQQSTIVDCELYGKPGQAQEGIDILASGEGEEKFTCYQCKRVTDATPALVRNAVDKFLDGRWAERTSLFVLCLAVPTISTGIRDEVAAQFEKLRGRDVEFHLWDASPSGRLVEMLKACPQIVDDFFGRPWVELFNGEDAAHRLGNRLDNSDAITLRRRLRDLYGVIFDQHDPGPPKPLQGDKASYLQRYVATDVVEQVRRSDTGHAAAGTQESATVNYSLGPGSDDPSAYSHATTVLDETGAEMEARMPGVLVSTTGSDELSFPVFEWLADKHKCLVLGEPGSGKSTLLRFLALSLVSDRHDQPSVLPDALKKFPIWISFARYSAAIRDVAHTSVEDYFNQWLHEHSFDDVQPLFVRALRHSEAFLLVDGLDEAVDTKHGREAFDRIVTFSHSVDAMIISTSRPSARPRFAIPDEWNAANIAPMRDTHVHDLAKRWFIATEFGSVEDVRTDPHHTLADDRATRFLRAAKASPRTNTLVRNPMLCRATIQLYQSSHRLPVSRAKIYDDIVELLLSRHPAARAHAAMADTPTESLELSTDDLRELLVRLASEIQSGSDVDARSTVDCETTCARFLGDETEGLGLTTPVARRLARTAIEQLASDFGLLAEKGSDMLGFVHLSIQEHLAAEHVTRMADEDQLAWLSGIWQKRKWRECITDWFAIQGLRGNRRLAGIAALRLQELGEAGEWQRMQSLELRTELACADIGLPVGLSRIVIAEAGRSVAASPYPSHRTSIAKSLTLGALSPQLHDACAPWVQRWIPSRAPTSRASLLRSFDAWAEADDLRVTLLQALQDEDHECRAAAAHSLVSVFSSWPDLGAVLQGLAESNTRPEVRAIALRTLATKPEWHDRAARACETNAFPSSDELAFSIVVARVKNGQYRDEDLQRLSSLFSNHSIEFALGQEFVDTLCLGWPQRPSIRRSFESFLDSQVGTLYYGIPLAYLIRCYPDDAALASRLARLFDRHGLHIGFDTIPWADLIDGYGGHPEVAAAVRRAIDAYKDEYSSIMWHPTTLPAFAVIGGNAVRDELVEAYAQPVVRDWDRYWIAHTLITNWPDDEGVVGSIQHWASLAADFAAPLAPWADRIHGEASHRREWLSALVAEASPQIVTLPMQALLDAFPDEEAQAQVRARSSEEGIWYYHHVRIQALLARCFPAHPSSEKTVEHALSQIDGPPLSELSIASEHHRRFRGEVLRASVAAPEDLRNTVAVTLRDHALDVRTVETLSPHLLAEVSPSVRTTLFVARARVAKNDVDAAQALTETLTAELSSRGHFYEVRRLSALAGLLELGRADSAADALAKHGSLALDRHLNPFENYSAAIAVIVDHWPSLQPLLLDAGLDAELPVENLVEAGYGSVVGQSKAGQVALDLYLRVPNEGAPSSRRLQQLARRFPRSLRLRDELLAALAFRSRERGTDCDVTQLLIEHFKGDSVTLANVATQLRDRPRLVQSLEPGAISLLRLGWPDDVRHLLPDRSDLDEAFWTDRDRLLHAIAEQDGDTAARVVESMVLDPARNWRYRQDDQYGLRIWSRQPMALPVLQRWCESDNGTLAVTGLALSSPSTLRARDTLDRLIDRFNGQSLGDVSVPTDGLDATTGNDVAWNVGALDTIRALQ